MFTLLKVKKHLLSGTDYLIIRIQSKNKVMLTFISCQKQYYNCYLSMPLPFVQVNAEIL